MRLSIEETPELRLVGDKMWRILREFGGVASEEDLRLRVRELVRFLTLKAHGLSCFLPVDSEIDSLWHIFILETEEYPAFCDRIRKGTFLHHRQNRAEWYEDREGAEAFGDRDLAALASYVASFGPFDELAARHWRGASWLRSEKGMSLEEVNAFILKVVSRSNSMGEK